MSELFLTVLNMSLTASYVILFVILVRLLLKKAPKIIAYALWGVVAFRLIIPFSFESMFSLMPRNTNAVPIPHDIIYQQSPQINSGIEVVDSFVSQSLPAPTVGASVNPLQIYTEIAAYIWVIGIIALLVYNLVSILILKRQLKNAQLIEQNIYEFKNLKTPFVLGLIRPKIFLPVGLNATERSYILLHEQTHIQRKDHIIKILAFLVLSIHWFNPLVWIAFVLMSTDMELSCDEQVLKEMHEDIKKPYANSLLSLATGRHIINGSPLAFGEGNVRGRIKNVLNFKKPTVWIIVVSIALVAVLSVGLAANRATNGTGDYDFYNFYVNGFMLGADINEMDTSTLMPTEPLNVKNGYDFNFEEVRYSADEETGRLRKMCVNVYDDGVVSMLVAHANGKDNVSLDSNQTYQIEGIMNILGKGETGWHDREQGLRYMEYRHKEGRLSATVRFVYMDRSKGIPHRLVWIIAESSLPYPYPYPDEKQFRDLRPMIKVGDMLFLDTNKEISIEIGDSDIIGEVVSSVNQHEKPVENGQTNFGSIGSKYAYYDDGLVVLLKNKWIFFEKENNIYPLEFFQLSNAKIENLQLDNINKIIEEKIIDKERSTFIFTDNENSEFKGGINLNGKSYYIGQVSMENTPEDLMGIEEIQVFGKKAVKFYGILGANYAQAFYWLVEEKPENSIIQIDGNTIEIDLDNDGKKEVVATTGTIPETKIYMLKEGKIAVSDINKSIGAKSVSLYDEGKKLFEVYFEPNKPERYVFNKDSFIRR
ncbi:MAG: M56 family metallopeptidase [Lutispora sp.]|nr:M56 family metallopeptidase [Lutispora sp.]